MCCSSKIKCEIIVPISLCRIWGYICISAKMLKMPISHAPVHTGDAESDICMNIILKHNTCIIKPHRHHWQTVHSIFHQIWTFLYGPLLSLKFVPKGPINNIPALVQIMAWCQPGNKPLSEPMMVSLTTHIFITWPQWVNGLASVEGY